MIDVNNKVKIEKTKQKHNSTSLHLCTYMLGNNHNIFIQMRLF